MRRQLLPQKKIQKNLPLDGYKMTQHIQTSPRFSKMHSHQAGDFSASKLINHLPARTSPATNATENCFKENGRNPEDGWNCVCLK